MSHPRATIGGMSKAHEIVKTGMSLAAFFRRYPTDQAAEKQWEAWRWPDGPQCPHCQSDNIAIVRERRPMPYRCRTCRKHFSVMSHTVMHASKLGSQTWLLALFLILSNSKGRSSVQLAADLGYLAEVGVACRASAPASASGGVAARFRRSGGSRRNVYRWQGTQQARKPQTASRARPGWASCR